MLTFCSAEFDELNNIREEQKQTREERLEEKRAVISRMLNPSPPSVKSGKKKGKSKVEQNEQLAETHNLGVLETPEDIVLKREGF